MYPIYEKAAVSGIGLDLNSFFDRFEEICQRHIDEKRASAFAFIFYDFESSTTIRSILGKFDAFTELDRLVGRDLTIFYLNTGRKKVIEAFNSEFIGRLELGNAISLPCVAFFKLSGGEIFDIEIAQLDRVTAVRGFHALFVAIERYLNSGKNLNGTRSKYITWLRSGAKFTSLEAFRIVLKEAIEHFLK